jgi:site-specific DNA-methyltransferase (adenine-specific)
MGQIILADNLDALRKMTTASIPLIYIDPPFNTGKVQSRTQIKTVHDDLEGDRIGFAGRSYRTEKLGTTSYSDTFDDFIGFLRPRIEEAYRILAPTGSLFFHIDYREVHYCKIMLDEIFGRDCFQNEIIWAYDYGARTKKRWPAKHDNILWYSKDRERYTFNLEECDRIAYMAPGLVGPEKAARGKTPTDVWWHTIVPARKELDTPPKSRLGFWSEL